MSRQTQQPETLVVWEGEWPYVKAGVAQVRHTFIDAVRVVQETLNLPTYVAMARRYTDTTDRFVTSLAVDMHANLRQHDWVARAAGVLVASSFVMAKSIPLGAHKTGRNGLLCSALLIALMFPAELAHCLDHRTWFGTRELSSRTY
eukprot:gene4815-3457_t